MSIKVSTLVPIENLREWQESSSREWLVTNGIGGFASGTIAGARTRRYHGLLVAALSPPADRMLLVAGVHETVFIEGQSILLGSAQWWDGAIFPRGFERLVAFEIDADIPVFTFDCAGTLLKRRIGMDPGRNRTRIRYLWPEDSPPAILSIKLLIAFRDFHGRQSASSETRWRTALNSSGAAFSMNDNAPAIVARVTPTGRFMPENEWYYGEFHSIERDRGLEDTEDLWVPGSLEVPLCPGGAVTLLLSTDADMPDPEEAHEAEGANSGQTSGSRTHTGTLVQAERLPGGANSRDALAAFPSGRAILLDQAADAFLIRRRIEGEAVEGSPNSVIAGYPWFADWGRDTLISLPGLTLARGKPEIAREILMAYSHFVDRGMLPNRFPDRASERPEYNTVDATLWYFQAIGHYLSVTGDRTLIEHLFPVLEDIVSWHTRGTRYGIQVDPADGLLRAGEPGMQLTWMDARVGNEVVTPRVGKPVEIQALWHGALRLMAEWAPRCGASAEGAQVYRVAADWAAVSFRQRFPIPGKAWLYDLVDGPEGDDDTLRPNQLFALSLPPSSSPLVDREMGERVLHTVEGTLLTPRGLRTLDPSDPRYVGVYEGSVAKRDGAYHQGTVWPWLTGAYVEATLKVTGKLDRAREALDALLEGLFEAGIGTLSEIYDGDPPHRPRGCIAQAWSVAEAVRALDLLNRVRGESSPAEPSVRREEVTPDGAPANGPGGDGS